MAGKRLQYEMITANTGTPPTNAELDDADDSLDLLQTDEADSLLEFLESDENNLLRI